MARVSGRPPSPVTPVTADAQPGGSATAMSDRTRLGFAAVALFVAALNLRPAVAAVSPLVDRIRTDLDLSATGVSLLTVVPTLAMGVCAPLAAYVGRRWGLHAGVLLGLAVVTVGTAARVGGEATWIQLSSAAVVGTGIAVTQTLLPAVVKARFADRAGLVTGIYTAGLGLGGAIAAGASAPLAEAVGSWPGALASWAVLAVLGMVMWAAAAPSLNIRRSGTAAGPATSGLPWRDATAWRVAAISAINSGLYYCELAWVAPLLHDDAGYTEARAGVLLTAMICVQVVAMLMVPSLLGRRSDLRPALAGCAVVTAIGFLGLAASPGTPTWVWLLLLGIGHGGLFPLVLMLPVVASVDPDGASRLGAMAFFVGYGCAAISPLVVGVLRDVLGGFTQAFGLLAVVTLIALYPIIRLTPAD
ncbi:CynX/NimT family MFS transporter [Phytoactinopolyspora limicola]|uniref:MFS transporter n=1 Tax=Phytoactinopolyspora limicola TaxID=2715536 RepID=UPI0014075D46|nr:MFS transporter [Phytoactinopolyspora limicola]